jgi:hypothetical protein
MVPRRFNAKDFTAMLSCILGAAAELRLSDKLEKIKAAIRLAGIREMLVERGQVARDGVNQATLTNLDLSRAERAHARHCSASYVFRFRRRQQQLEVALGSYATVEASNLSLNLTTVRAENGAIVEYAPGPFIKGVEVFRAESRTLASGDRIQFRAPDHAFGVANGEFAAVIAIDGG